MRGRGLAGTRQTVERRDSTTQGPSPLRAALLLTACVWCVLLAGRAAARWLDPAWAVAGSFAVAAALVRFAGPPGAHAAARHPRPVEGAALLLGLGAGYSLFPAWLALPRGGGGAGGPRRGRGGGAAAGPRGRLFAVPGLARAHLGGGARDRPRSRAPGC